MSLGLSIQMKTENSLFNTAKWKSFETTIKAISIEEVEGPIV